MYNYSNKILIVGLGNIGIIYKNSRHNLGFQVIDKIIEIYSLTSDLKTFGSVSKIQIKKKNFFY